MSIKLEISNHGRWFHVAAKWLAQQVKQGPKLNVGTVIVAAAAWQAIWIWGCNLGLEIGQSVFDQYVFA